MIVKIKIKNCPSWSFTYYGSGDWRGGESEIDEHFLSEEGIELTTAAIIIATHVPSKSQYGICYGKQRGKTLEIFKVWRLSREKGQPIAKVGGDIFSLVPLIIKQLHGVSYIFIGLEPKQKITRLLKRMFKGGILPIRRQYICSDKATMLSRPIIISNDYHILVLTLLPTLMFEKVNFFKWD